MIGPTDFVTISAMNFCFGLCFMIVPKIAEMVFSGSGFASVGMAAAKVAGKAMKFAAVSGLPAMGKASVIGATFGKVGGAVVKANSGVGQDGAAGSSSDSKSKNPLATQKSNHHVDSGSSAGNKKTSQSTQGNTYYDGGQGI